MSFDLLRCRSTADIQRTASALGAWRNLSSLVLEVYTEVRPEGELHHAASSRHHRETHNLQHRPWRSLSGMVCWCLPEFVFDTFPQRSLPPSQWGVGQTRSLLLRRILYSLILEEAQRELEEDETSPVRRRALRDLVFLEDQVLVSDFQLSSIYTPAQVELVAVANERLREGVLAGAKECLTRASRSEAARSQALISLVEGTWLSHVPRDETELLVGFWGPDPARETTATNVRELYLSSLVHEGDPGKFFYRMPRYALEFLMSEEYSPGHYRQYLPWQEDLPLSELSRAWDPSSRSALANLQNALDMLLLA